MNSPSVIQTKRAREKHAGLTLLGVLGAIAIVGVMAAVITPPIIRTLTHSMAEAEEKTLDSFAQGLRRYVTTHQQIPSAETGPNGEPDWAQAISEVLAVSPAQVRQNPQDNPRLYLPHPDFFGSESSLSLPYTQAEAELPSDRPPDPRILIVGSTHHPLPEPPYDFDAIWNTGEDEPPEDWDWNGDGSELKIERIHLGDLFNRLILFRSPDADKAYYSFGDSDGTPTELERMMECYLIAGTPLNLYEEDPDSESPELVSRELIRNHESRLFHKGGWKLSNPEGLVGDGSGNVTIENNVTNVTNIFQSDDGSFPPGPPEWARNDDDNPGRGGDDDDQPGGGRGND